MKRKQVAFRVTQEQEDMLTELSSVTGMNKNDLFVGWITAEYDKIKGNPELKKLLEQMNLLKDQLNNFGGIPK